jgi:hypothetical protein
MGFNTVNDVLAACGKVYRRDAAYWEHHSKSIDQLRLQLNELAGRPDVGLRRCYSD